MNNSFLINPKSQIIYGGIWVLLALIQTLLFYLNLNQAILPVLVDSLVFNGLYLICIIGIGYPSDYYRNVNIPLFTLFHLFLLILCLLISIGGTALAITSFFPDTLYNTFFVEALPFRIYGSTFIYLVAILSYYLLQTLRKVKKQAEEIVMLKNETDNPEKLSRIAVKKNKEIRFISVNDVEYIEANGDYVLIHTGFGRFIKDKTMKYWEMHLSPSQFVRIHRSFILNIEYLAKLELYEKELYHVQLKSGVTLKVSNSGYKLLKQKMQ
jgi:hydrogenase maturation factor